MRDSIVFYRSFYEAIKEIPMEEQGIVYNAIYGYALDGIFPELKGVAKAIFLLVKPQIDANNSKYENGKKGGRTKTEPNPNQSETKDEPNPNQSETKDEPNENVNVNVNVNVNEKAVAEEKEKKEEKPAAAAAYVSHYENNIGIIPPFVAEKVNSYELPDEVVIEAINEAVSNNVRTPKYIYAILESCVRDKIQTSGQFKARKLEHENNKPRGKPPDKPTSAYVNPQQKEFSEENLKNFYAN
jgi:DnaD/phage-associated family protein